MDTVGKRLREERLRLGLSQAEFAALGGRKNKTQLNYEANASSPDAAYLLALGEIGVDIFFVLKGERSSLHASEACGGDPEEAELVGLFRELSDAGKAALMAFAISSVKALAKNSTASPRRVKRLAENRRAALDERTAQNVQRAMAEIDRLSDERSHKTQKK